MEVATILYNFNTHGGFLGEEILAIRSDRALRAQLVDHFRTHRNRAFALALLDKFIELRKDLANEISMDDLMLGSFILGMHGQVEDCLKVWEAKRVDFDSYCGVDIQLVPFAGVEETIAFLETKRDDPEAAKALEHVLACQEADDFEDLEEYYQGTPWWV